jgi:hypothetical protein
LADNVNPVLRTTIKKRHIHTFVATTENCASFSIGLPKLVGMSKLFLNQFLLRKKRGNLLYTLLFIGLGVSAQDLEPRAYIRLPSGLNVVLPGFSYSSGRVLTDPSVPLKDFKASVGTFSLGYARTFSLFGKSAQAFAVVPLCVANASALVNGQFQEVDRRGSADMRGRLSVLLIGGKSSTKAEFAKQKKPSTILGTSLTMQMPTGQYFADKLVNLGSGRWAFKPEIALSQALSKRWLLDLYTAAWFFTDNHNYFGNTLRAQHAIGSIQTHISYNIGPLSWAAFDATYYTGGKSTVNDAPNNDKVSNVRLGTTLALPTSKRSGLKIAFTTGALVVKGSDFTTVSVGWSYTWF